MMPQKPAYAVATGTDHFGYGPEGARTRDLRDSREAH
jgi:hypothetical protein